MTRTASADSPLGRLAALAWRMALVRWSVSVRERAFVRRVVRARRVVLTVGIALAGVIPLRPVAGEAASLFALVDTGEIFVSADAGSSWSVRATLPVHDAVGLAAGATSAELYLATRAGTVYRSADAGAAWDAVGAAPAGDLAGLVAHTDGRVQLLTESGTLWESTDQAASFVALAALSGHDFVGLASDGVGRLYALTATGDVHRSEDGGSSWVPCGSVTASDAVSLRALADDLFVLTAAGVVWRSDDLGNTWWPAGTLSQVHMSALTTDGVQLVAATREGEVAVSADGAGWTWRGAVNQLSVTALANDTTQGSSVPGQGAGARRIAMGMPWPNPWVPGGAASHMTFPFALAQGDLVRLDVYDVHGRLMASAAPRAFETGGSHAIVWTPPQLPAGVFFARVSTASGCAGQAGFVVLR